MGIIELILLGVALSADAMSVTICNILANPRLNKVKQLAMPVFFGVFQGLMPAIGYFAGNVVAELIEKYAGIIALVILAFIGGKMIWDAFHEEEEEGLSDLSYKALFMQAIATSIDAFAVGVAFVGDGTNIFVAAPIITVCTFLLCLVTLKIGMRFGDKLGKGAEIAGGVILILIGLKACFF